MGVKGPRTGELDALRNLEAFVVAHFATMPLCDQPELAKLLAEIARLRRLPRMEEFKTSAEARHMLVELLKAAPLCVGRESSIKHARRIASVAAEGMRLEGLGR